MTDRELLELAAKAAGVKIDWDGDNPLVVRLFRGHLKNWLPWNPLIDDGDALRLATKLEIGIEFQEYEVWCDGQFQLYEWKEHKGDRNSATRRAIVRAAAELGRQSSPAKEE